MVTVNCRGFDSGCDENSTLIEAYGVVDIKGKCLGCLTCVVKHSDDTQVCLKVIGVSGNGGKIPNNIIRSLKKHNFGLNVFIAPPNASRTIYHDISSRTLVQWHPEFIEEFSKRLTNEIERIYNDACERGGVANYNLKKFKKALSKNVMYRRIRTKLDWRAYFDHWMKLVSEFQRLTSSNERPVERERFVDQLTKSPSEILLECLGDRIDWRDDCIQRIAGADNRRQKAVEIAQELIIPNDPPTDEEKNSTNGIAQLLLACVDPSQDAARQSGIADIFVRCAEDNCTSAMLTQLDVLGKDIVSIDVLWVATRRNHYTGVQENFPLCPFCDSRFVHRVELLLRNYISNNNTT